MFCSKCGNQLPDDARFCNECGNSISTEPAQGQQAPQYQYQAQTPPAKPVVSIDVDAIKGKLKNAYKTAVGDNLPPIEVQPEYEKFPHPYHTLGGWLGFVTYGLLIGIALLVVLAFVSFIQITQVARYIGGGGWFAFVQFILFVGMGFVAFFCVKMFIMIKNKNPRFLRFYELMTLMCVAIYFVTLILTGFRGFGQTLLSMVEQGIIFTIWTTYFRKSVRVRTYMGSDAYLRQSIFFKNSQAPAPADTQPYVAPQPYSPTPYGAPIYSQNPAYNPQGANNSARTFCSSCGTELIGDAVFCSGCGAKRVEQTIISEPPTQTPALATEEQQADISVEAAEQPVSPAAKLPEKRYCSKCGTELIGDAVFCSGCGERTAGQETAPNPPAYAAPTASYAPVAPVAPMPQQQPIQQPFVAPAYNPPVSGGFFDLGEYVIDERVSAFKFTNAYKVFNTAGQQIGVVEQQKVGGGAKAARILLGGNVKAMQSFKLDIKDANGLVLASIQRGGLGTQGGIRNISILNGNGQLIGTLRIMFSWITPKLEIHDPSGQVVGLIQGDWKGWNFTISDAHGTLIGTVNKKWAGAMKEIFTTADKYHVTVYPNAGGAFRPTIIAAAITLDMVMKESK
jgi:uncharacterized protein YxjI/predicted amidophosphoribosyltransferase